MAKKIECPNCDSKNTIKTVYGYPTSELFEKAEEGKVKLGGCCIITGSPNRFCKDCKYEWARNNSII